MLLITLISVAIMLLYSVPGFILVKSQMVKEQHIPSFAVLLMYVCQPCLTIYSFQKAEFSLRLLKNLGIVFLLALILMAVMLLLFFLVFRKKYEDSRYRVATVCCGFGNCTFIGLPLLEELLPNNPEVSIYSIAFFIAMSILGWTVGSALITQDLKYIKPKKVILNPAVLALVVALPLFIFNIRLPQQLGSAVTLVGKMSTPLCMLIIGMRLATVKLRELFLDSVQYLAAVLKQFLMPALGFLLIYFLPVDYTVKIAFYIMSACPTAAVVLTFAEMLGSGQKTSANIVLLSTISCILSMPVMIFVFQSIVK